MTILECSSLFKQSIRKLTLLMIVLFQWKTDQTGSRIFHLCLKIRSLFSKTCTVKKSQPCNSLLNFDKICIQ